MAKELCNSELQKSVWNKFTMMTLS
jgi:hypothetical protein